MEGTRELSGWPHSKTMNEPKAKARFVEPMLLFRTERLPEGDDWLYEILNSMGTERSRLKVAENSACAQEMTTTSMRVIRRLQKRSPIFRMKL